nr:hypothetical protein [Nanoarchaeum sp.]
MEWKNLAPNILRQRLIIEGFPSKEITDKQIKDYLINLSRELNMKALSEPTAHLSEKFGWAGWIHWESSGCHFYAWDKPKPFFSADIYTCKSFSVEKAADFTKNFFKTSKLVWKEVKV